MLDRLTNILFPNRSNVAVACDADEQSYEIELNGKQYPIRFKRSARSKSVSLSADVIEGEVKITLPRNEPVGRALRFADEKKQWLAASFSDAPEGRPLEVDGSFPYEGDRLFIRWDRALPRKIALSGDEITLGGAIESVQPRVLRWLKQNAIDAYTYDLKEYCERADAKIPALAIGDARGRWGSYSSRGTMRISWRLIMAPPFVRRSVIAHEVAHIKHMDHSREFYDWLDFLYEGNRKQADLWLRKNGKALHMVGRN